MEQWTKQLTRALCSLNFYLTWHTVFLFCVFANLNIVRKYVFATILSLFKFGDLFTWQIWNTLTKDEMVPVWDKQTQLCCCSYFKHFAIKRLHFTLELIVVGYFNGWAHARHSPRRHCNSSFG